MLARGKVIYYDEIKDQLHDVSKDISSKADDTSAEVDILRKSWGIMLRFVMF